MTSVEQGRRNVSLDTIERIAVALELDTGQLLTQAEAERSAKRSRAKRAEGDR
jgi:hypothetical protein